MWVQRTPACWDWVFPCFECVCGFGLWATSRLHWEARPPPPSSSPVGPRLTGHLGEAGQPAVGIVQQQDSVLAQLHAPQEQVRHFRALLLLDAACGGARTPVSRGLASPPALGPQLLTQQGQQPQNRTAGFRHLCILGEGGQHLSDKSRGSLQGGLVHDDSCNGMG